MKQWIADYIQAQKAAHDSIPGDAVEQLIETLRMALKEDRQIFVFGNGGSAANASHFATDLGKLASDKIGKRFRVLSLNDNVGWLTALANDYAYEDVFVGQLQNYAKPGDIALSLSVSGNSPNCVKALEWAQEERPAHRRAGRRPARAHGGDRGAGNCDQRHALRAGRGRADGRLPPGRATRLWRIQSWESRQDVKPLLFRQLLVSGLAEDVEEQSLPFLNARRVGAWDQQVERGHAFGEAAVTAQETNALHLLPVRFFQRAQHIA